MSFGKGKNLPEIFLNQKIVESIEAIGLAKSS